MSLRAVRPQPVSPAATDRKPLPPDVRAALVYLWAEILVADYLQRHGADQAPDEAA